MDALEDEGRYKEADALAAATVREQLSDALRHMARDSSEGGNALIIDGKALVHALADDCRAALLAVRGSAFPHTLSSHPHCQSDHNLSSILFARKSVTGCEGTPRPNTPFLELHFASAYFAMSGHAKTIPAFLYGIRQYPHCRHSKTYQDIPNMIGYEA